jgi:hypothetical protein
MMTMLARITALVLALCALASAAPRQHAVTFGQWMPVKWFVGPAENKAQDIKIRGLYVDSKLREFTMGDPHDITDRVFVVRRAYRVNDWLPDDPKSVPKWKWQRSGWLLVDRQTGRVSALNLPDFDPFYSAVGWYRDYAAYCGLSSDAERVYAVVEQIGRRKPLIRKEVGAAHNSDVPDSECPAPKWQRQPARVTFEPVGSAPLTFEIHGSAVEIPELPEPSADTQEK